MVKRPVLQPLLSVGQESFCPSVSLFLFVILPSLSSSTSALWNECEISLLCQEKGLKCWGAEIPEDPKLFLGARSTEVQMSHEFQKDPVETQIWKSSWRQKAFCLWIVPGRNHHSETQNLHLLLRSMPETQWAYERERRNSSSTHYKKFFPCLQKTFSLEGIFLPHSLFPHQ